MLPKIVISRETYGIIQPLILVARIFGLCPVSCNKKNANFVLKWSISYTIYSYLLAIYFITSAVLGIINDLQLEELKSYRMQTKKGRVITSCDMSIVILIAIFGITTLPWRIKEFFSVLMECTKIDKFVPQTSYQMYRRKSIIFIITIYFCFTIVMVFDMCYWVKISSQQNKSGSRYVFNYIGFYVLYYTLITQEIFYCHLVYLINIKLNLLNKYLVMEEQQGLERKKYTERLSLVNRHIDTLFQRNILNDKKMTKIKFEKKFAMMDESNVDRMQILGVIHKSITDAVEIINGTMSNGIMLIMLSCLVHLIITPYFLLTESIKTDGSTLFMFLDSFWIVVHICRLLILVEPCNSCLKEGQKTTKLVCDLLRLYNIDEDFKMAIASFNTQVLQNQIKFSCSGLFMIDRSLITSIAGSVTTYIVIVLEIRN